MTEISVEVPDHLALVARVLKDIDKELPKDLERGLGRVATKLEADAKREAGKRLPRRGGLGARVAASKLSTRFARGGVTIQPTGMAQLAGMDAGQVKHPVFGNRSVWVTQEVTGGWFSEPMEAGRDDVAKAIGEVLDDLAVKAAARLD